MENETILLKPGDRIIHLINGCVLQLIVMGNGFAWKCITLPTGDNDMAWRNSGDIGSTFEKDYCRLTQMEQKVWSLYDHKSDNFRTIYNILNDGTI